MMRVVSCKCSTLLSLAAVVVALLVLPSACMADWFTGLTAQPGVAKLGDSVEISFCSLYGSTPSWGPCVYVNNQGTYFLSFDGTTYWYDHYVTEDDPDGWADIWVCADGYEDYYSGWALLIDKTAPQVTGVADDGAYTPSTTQLHASWSISDATSGISDIQYAIGTTPGGTNVRNWTSIATTNVSGFTATGLTLTWNSTYYISVKACDVAGNWSTPVNTDGIAIRNTPDYFTGLTAQPSLAEPGDSVEISVCSLYGSTPSWGPYVYVNNHGTNYLGFDGTAYWFSYYVTQDDPTGWADISVVADGYQNYYSNTALWIEAP